MTQLPRRTVSDKLTSSLAFEVILIETVEVRAGDVVEIRFGPITAKWEQGVWLGIDGIFEVEGKTCAQVVLWQDPTEALVKVRIVDTNDGLLRFYNIWDSGRGIRPYESLKATSGMVRAVEGDWASYSCSDISVDPQFDRLHFAVRVQRGSP